MFAQFWSHVALWELLYACCDLHRLSLIVSNLSRFGESHEKSCRSRKSIHVSLKYQNIAKIKKEVFFLCTFENLNFENFEYKLRNWNN